MNRADLDHLLRRCAERLAGEVDTVAKQLHEELESQRAQLPYTCQAAVVLQELAGLASQGRHMSRTDDPEIMRVWATADLALSQPCCAHPPSVADLVYNATVTDRSNAWINGRVPFQPLDADVVQVWRAGRGIGQAIPTLSQKTLDMQFEMAQLRTSLPPDEGATHAQQVQYDGCRVYMTMTSAALESLQQRLADLGL